MPMQCPKCGAEDSYVIESRSTKTEIRRRRECNYCYHRFTTYESCRRSSVATLWQTVRPRLMKNISDAVIRTFENIDD